MMMMDSFVADMFHRIAEEAQTLVSRSSRTTMNVRDVQTAIRLVLPGELQKHAVSEGTKSVVRFPGAYPPRDRL